MSTHPTFPIREARVGSVAGHPVVLVNGAPLYVSMYAVRSLKKAAPTAEGMCARRSALVREWASHDLHGYTGGVDIGWTPEGFDPAARSAPLALTVDDFMSSVLAGDPQAYVILQAYPAVPAFWREAHPGEFEQDAEGRAGLPSMGSVAYQQAAAEGLATFVRYVEAQPYAGHVLGYNVQMGMEGFTAAAFANTTADYSPAMREAFRGWLHERYASDAELQTAWGDPTVTRDTATVPSMDEQLTGQMGVFRDPVQARRVIDYRYCVSDCSARGIACFLRAVKEACEGKKLAGTYGNYLGVMGWSRGFSNYHGTEARELNTHATAGNSHWGRTLENSDLDFVIANHDYYYRRPGGGFIPSNLPASLSLHGKLAFIGDDTRSYLHTDEWYGRAASPEATRAMHRRNAAVLATEAGGNDWVEQMLNWLFDPPILDELGRLNGQLQQAILREDAVDPIAVIIDEEAVHYETPGRDLDWVAIYKQRIFPLAHCGVPVRIYLLSDLLRDDYPRAKCYLFLNAWYADEVRKAAINRLKCNGNVLVWLYGAGICSPRGIDAAGMVALTDIAVTARETRFEQLIPITNWNHPLTASLPADAVSGTEYQLSPTFTVTDPEATVLGAMLLPPGMQEPALAVKDLGTHRSVYSAAPALTTDLLRNIARYAGCHVYNEANDVITAGRGILALHAIKPGMRTLHLPQPSRVTELESGELVAEGVSEFEVQVEGASTLLFRVEGIK
ncbi:MAG TPA: hypothetical protein VGM23_01435 [Armatimonadota bacterium]